MRPYIAVAPSVKPTVTGQVQRVGSGRTLTDPLFYYLAVLDVSATARKSAWQFIQKTNDPRISMVRKFAAAVGVSLKSLV